MSGGHMQKAVDDLALVLERVKGKQLRAFRDEILASRRVFVTGLGRTGLMARGFAMRLMHLGRRVYHVGDVITPAIAKGDLLVICSRTGKSKVLRHYVNIARQAKARVALVTARPDGPVGERAHCVVHIDDSVAREGKRPRERQQPLGSLFEQSLLIVLDQVVLDLMDQLDLTEDDMARSHTEFE